MTIQEAIRDLEIDENKERVAECLDDHTIIHAKHVDRHANWAGIKAIMSPRWITRDAR